MRFFVAKGAPQNDGGFLVVRKSWWRFALERLWRGRLRKSGDEPPHSRVSRHGRHRARRIVRRYCESHLEGRHFGAALSVKQRAASAPEAILPF